jgi:hypothetical protein
MGKFMLLIRGGYDSEPHDYSPEDIEAAIERYRDWAMSLRERNCLIEAVQLDSSQGKKLVKRHGQIVVDGPFVETKETIGGYFTIEAESYIAALEIAKECPIFEGGGHIEIRQIEN